MHISRHWMTPLAAGAFLLSAVTGILIFFHLDIGLNKLAHEWLSWLLLFGVVLHVASHFSAFKRHLASPRGLGVIGMFVLLLALSFVWPAVKRDPPFVSTVRGLSELPIATLATAARSSPEAVRAVLVAEGLQPTSDEQTLAQLAGAGARKQLKVLEKIFATRPATVE